MSCYNNNNNLHPEMKWMDIEKSVERCTHTHLSRSISLSSSLLLWAMNGNYGWLREKCLRHLDTLMCMKCKVINSTLWQQSVWTKRLKINLMTMINHVIPLHLVLMVRVYFDIENENDSVSSGWMSKWMKYKNIKNNNCHFSKLNWLLCIVDNGRIFVRTWPYTG